MIAVTSAVYVTEMTANRGIDIDIDSPVTAQKPVELLRHDTMSLTLN